MRSDSISRLLPNERPALGVVMYHLYLLLTPCKVGPQTITHLVDITPVPIVRGKWNYIQPTYDWAFHLDSIFGELFELLRSNLDPNKWICRWLDIIFCASSSWLIHKSDCTWLEQHKVLYISISILLLYCPLGATTTLTVTWCYTRSLKQLGCSPHSWGPGDTLSQLLSADAWYLLDSNRSKSAVSVCLQFMWLRKQQSKKHVTTTSMYFQQKFG